MSIVDVHNINKLDIQKIRVTEEIGWQLRFVMTPHTIKAYLKTIIYKLATFLRTFRTVVCLCGNHHLIQ